MHLFSSPAFISLLAMPSFGQMTKITIIYIAAVAFVLGVLVFVHEFGHYAVAKLCGVRVEVFSLGFGKRIWGFRRGNTDYRLSLLPIGGYVKMSGENPMEDRTGDPGEFMSHPRWQRFLIAIAGPAMNILLALFLLTGLYMYHHDFEAYLRVPVDLVTIDPNSPAAQAGLQTGDRIIKVNDVQNPTWQEFRNTEFISPNQPLELTIKRGDKVMEKSVIPNAKGPEKIGDIGVEHPQVVGTLEPDGPALAAGVKVNDVLLSVDGTIVRDIPQMLEQLQASKDQPIKLVVLRDGKEVAMTLTPKVMDGKYRVGLRADLAEKLPFRAALAQSTKECKENSLLIFKLVGGMLRRKIPMESVSGPIGIMKISGEAAMIGPAPLFYIMAMISLNLAIFNLFPIPILDGGLILLLLIESVMRRDIKQEIKERVYQAAFVFLLLFAAVVIFNDVAKSFHHM
jgi:regulator of sigma E protease